MASKARRVTASDKVAKLVDEGRRVNQRMKELEADDQSIKKNLAKEMGNSFGTDSSICVGGLTGTATITRVEKFPVVADVEDTQRIREAAEKGLFGDAVEVERVLCVPPADRERAAEELRKCGINASISTSISVVGDEYRVLRDSPSASVEAEEALEELESVVESDVSYRVKYESSK